MSLKDRFYVNRKGEKWGSGWVYPKGANSMDLSGLGFRKVLVGTGWAVSLFLCTVGSENSPPQCRASIFVSAPECRDIETALYDRTSVRAYVRTSVRTYVRL